MAARERQAQDRVDQQNAPSEVRTEPLPVGGNVGAYNSYWTEQSTSIVRTMRTSLITDPADGRLPELTPQALARITSPASVRLADVQEGRLPADGPEEMGLSERCLWYRGIPTLPTGYNNNYHFFQTPDFVLILQEHIHDLRVVYLDGRPHLPPAIHQFAGSSRGYWEGDTLVIETRNLREPFIRRWSRPEHSLSRGRLSESAVVTERFTRVGPDLLDYRFTVDDPDTWTRPLVRRPPLRAQPPADVRVRLPRGQLRHDEHHDRLARRGRRGGGAVISRPGGQGSSWARRARAVTGAGLCARALTRGRLPVSNLRTGDSLYRSG